MSSKHIFRHEYKGTTIEVITEEVDLPSICEQFENYLRACGFSFDGHIDIVKEDI